VTDGPRAAVVLTAALLAASACGARDGADTGGPPGAVPTFAVPPPLPPVSWADDGETLAVTTRGSSSCPTGPADVEAVGPQEIRVAVRPLFPDRDPCTADVAPTTSEVEVPVGISADQPLTVVLDFGDGVEDEVVLPPASR
jgi:hypothetical protein